MSLKLAHCQLGYRPDSKKILTLGGSSEEIAELPDHIPFYLRRIFDRIPRDHAAPEVWKGEFFRWPFDLEKGKLQPEKGRILFEGVLRKVQCRWGTFWQGEFTDFQEEGNFQIETDYACTFPIAIKSHLYERLEYGYLNYLYCQRSGMEIPGIRPAQHLDDGILDTDGSQIDATGGWYDAGDLRKWMFLTQPNLSTLALIAEKAHAGLRQRAVAEIEWGNRFFHAMMAPDGQVWEDLGGGAFKPGLDIEESWWYENHPGCNCNASDCRYTDNLPGSGDERLIRTRYNASVQFMFVRTQCQIAPHLETARRQRCIELAETAWEYGVKRGHDRRTLFLSEQLWAAVELFEAGSLCVGVTEVERLLDALLQRQDRGDEGLSGFFMEVNGSDGFRCIAMSCEPVMPLIRVIELRSKFSESLVQRCREAVTAYVDGYLLKDACSNVFGVTPYGVYVNPPFEEHQTFRDAGRGRGVRTFIHPFSDQQIVHGTGGVVTHQAALLARAGRLLGRCDWMHASETLVQWVLGHNPESLCLHTGVGYRHPTPFSGYETQIPNAMSVGHIGRPDDSPYLETGPLIEWSSQEIWDIIHLYLVEAVLFLKT